MSQLWLAIALTYSNQFRARFKGGGPEAYHHHQTLHILFLAYNSCLRDHTQHHQQQQMSKYKLSSLSIKVYSCCKAWTTAFSSPNMWCHVLPHSGEIYRYTCICRNASASGVFIPPPLPSLHPWTPLGDSLQLHHLHWNVSIESILASLVLELLQSPT